MFEFAEWLGATPLSVGIQSRLWLTPLLQTIHIIMVGIVFVSMLNVALRVLGKIRADQPLVEVWHRFAPWFWCALGVMAGTGLVLIISEPVREVTALSFWLKMSLLAIGIVERVVLRPNGRRDRLRPRSRRVGRCAVRRRRDDRALGRDSFPGTLDRLRRRDLAIVAPRLSAGS